MAFQIRHSCPQPERRFREACLVLQGVPDQETRVTCTACAGTLLLEFGLLSRLTGDPVYEERARAAAAQVYSEPSARAPG